MLDENLPTFFLKPSPDSIKHHETYFLTQYGSEPAAAYSLHHLDPAAPPSRGAYAVALLEAHNETIVYGEIVVRPAWTQPTLSQEEIRKNGGVPPPPQPITPEELVIQLYDPDLQVTVRYKAGSWGGSPSYEFSMPENTFRTPSGSALDRTLNDPAADATIPKINFVWRREGKLSKDMTCFMTGKSTDPIKKKKSKEPDIPVALSAGFKEVNIYESNLSRVEMEDPKGLEVVLLLGSAAIKDLWMGGMKEPYNVGDSPRKNSGGILGGRKTSSPAVPQGITPPLAPLSTSQNPATPPAKRHGAAVGGLYAQPQAARTHNNFRRQSDPPRSSTAPQASRDPLQQWQIDAETARLRAHTEAEAREKAREAERRRQEREKADEAETRRLRKMVEQEEKEFVRKEKERKRRQIEVDKETERLKKQYGDQSKLFAPAPPRSSQPYQQHRYVASSSNIPYRPHQPQLAPIPQNQVVSSHAPRPQPRPVANGGRSAPQLKEQKKKSFFNLKSSDSKDAKLKKKQSSLF